MPLDLKCLLLAIAGYLAVHFADQGLGYLWGTESPVGQLLLLLTMQIRKIAFVGAAFELAMGRIWGLDTVRTFELAWWKAIVTGAVFFGIWSFFGAAILRTAGLRLTRDEHMGLRQSLVFGARNLRYFVATPVLVAIFAGILWILNAMAGFLIGLPFLVGSLFAIVLFPLVLLSSLLVILSLLAGIFGLPLTWAGIAVEQNGSLEALSRAYSYISARPLRFFFGYFLLLVLMSVFLLVGDYFVATTQKSVKMWMVQQEPKEMISEPPQHVRHLQEAMRRDDTVRRRSEGILNVENFGDARWDYKPGFLWMWAFLNLFVLGFKGYALYLFLGGTLSLYLQLRRDVDGTDEEQIHFEDEAGGEPASGEEPRWVGETGDEPAKEPDAPEKDEGGDEPAGDADSKEEPEGP